MAISEAKRIFFIGLKCEKYMVLKEFVVGVVWLETVVKRLFVAEFSRNEWLDVLALDW